MKAANKKKLLLKKDDVVQVISGKDKGTVGKILKIDREKERVFVEGVNIQTKHKKAKGPEQPGEILREEGPIHYSNVLLYCKESNRGERIRVRINEDGSKSREFVKSGVTAD